MRPKTPRLVQTAYDWHSGQWSPLYSFSSTGGTVHSEEHREELKREIWRCMFDSEGGKIVSPREYTRLSKLYTYVVHCKVGVKA